MIYARPMLAYLFPGLSAGVSAGMVAGFRGQCLTGHWARN